MLHVVVASGHSLHALHVKLELNLLVVHGVHAVAGGHHGGRHAGGDVGSDVLVVVARGSRAGDGRVDGVGDGGSPGFAVVGHGHVVLLLLLLLLAILGHAVVIRGGSQRRHSGAGDGTAAGAQVVFVNCRRS